MRQCVTKIFRCHWAYFEAWMKKSFFFEKIEKNARIRVLKYEKFQKMRLFYR